MWTKVFLIVMSMTSVFGQRGSYASHGFGYPPLPNRTTTNAPDGLGNRFGENDMTTQRLPLEALGDRDLVDRLSKLPIDNQPFWFINWQALEAQRKNPQVYPQRPSPFAQSIANTNPGTGQSLNVGQNSLNSNTGSADGPNVPNSNTGIGIDQNLNIGQNSQNSNTGSADGQNVPNSNTGFGIGQNALNSNTAVINGAQNVPNSNTAFDNGHVSNSNVQLGNRHGSISESKNCTKINNNIQ